MLVQAFGDTGETVTFASTQNVSQPAAPSRFSWLGCRRCGAIPAGDRRADSGLRRGVVFHGIARGRKRLGNCHSGVGRAPAGHFRRPYHRAVPRAPRCCQPCPRSHGLRRTRAGMIYILISVVIGIAASTRQQPALRDRRRAALGILVSGVASAQVLRSLALDVHLPEHVLPDADAGAPAPAQRQFVAAVVFRARVPAKRKRKNVGAGSLYVRLAPQPCAPGPVASPSRPPFAPRSRRGREADLARIRLLSVSSPLQELRADLEMSFPTVADTRRKLRLGHALSLSFLMKTRRINLSRELIVYPKWNRPTISGSASHGYGRVRDFRQGTRQ